MAKGRWTKSYYSSLNTMQLKNIYLFPCLPWNQCPGTIEDHIENQIEDPTEDLLAFEDFMEDLNEASV